MSAPLPWFASEVEVGVLQQVLRETAHGALSLQLALAWQLRQRDPEQSLQLCQRLAVQVLLPDERARLCLLQAELALLRDELARAEAGAREALASFSTLHDAIGCADAQALLALLAQERGDLDAMDHALAALEAAAVGDSERMVIALALRARRLAPVNLKMAEAVLTRLPAPLDSLPASARCHLAYGQAFVHGICGRFGESIAPGVEAYRLALSSGQIYLGIKAACNVSYAFCNVQDTAAALEWAQLAQSLAAQLGLRASRAAAHNAVADVLRCMQRFDEALELLEESRAWLADQPASQQVALFLVKLAWIHLDTCQWDLARAEFSELLSHARRVSSNDLLDIAELGLAQTALAQHSLDEARVYASALLARPHAGVTRRIAALQLLAALAPEDGAGGPGVPPAQDRLCLLEQALELTRGLSHYAPPVALLDALAKAHAGRGQHAQALLFARQANAARRALQEQAGSHRVLALRVRRESQRMQTEAEAQRRQAETLAARNALLQEANAALEQLGVIGRDIVAQCSTETVCASLYRHLSALLEVDALVLFTLSDDERQLRSVFGRELGQDLPVIAIELDDALSCVARCARERCQFDAGGLVPVPGTQRMGSALFTPLLAGGRLLGVLTLQARRAGAYVEREQLLMTSLGAFVATALANARSLEQLRQTQLQTAQQRKFGSLGELVLGLGQEIQAPMTQIGEGGQELGARLDQWLRQLPELLSQLDVEAEALLCGLLQQMGAGPWCASTGGERMQPRQLAQLLHRAGLEQARPLAEQLLPLGSEVLLQQLLPLLRHPQHQLILQLLSQLLHLLDCVGRLGASAERAVRVVQALKSYARDEQGLTRQPVDLGLSLAAVLTLSQHRFAAGIELCQRIECLPMLDACPADMNRLWLLLLDCALDGLLKPGRLELTLCHQGEAARLILFSSAVADELQAPAALQKIIAGHGGDLCVERTITRGRRISVRLPYNREST